MPSVAEAIAAELAQAGVRRVFGLLGEGNLAIAVALEEQRRVQWTALRREDAVVCAADGYAQGTGGCGVALVTHGPALTNTITPLVGARKGGTPLVVITGEIDPAQSHAPQYLNQRSLIESIGVPYLAVDRPQTAVAVVRSALRQARRELRPVVVGIRTGFQAASDESVPDVRRESDSSDQDVSFSSAQLGAVAEVLIASRAPVVLAGRGAIGARAQLARLAEETGALLGTTLLARGLFAGNPRDVGVCGGFAPERARAAMAAADLILVFGASLNDYTTVSGSLFKNATVVQVDRQLEAFGRRYVPDLAVAAEAGAFAEQLRDLVAGSISAARWSEPPEAIGPEFVDESDDTGLDLRTVSVMLDRHLPPGRAFVSDLGYFTSEPTKFVAISAPEYQAFCLHFGSIGMGLATAIGLSAAHPDVPTLCAVGDGGLAASLGELETLARLRLPITVAVFNDSAYGVEWQALRHDQRDTALSEFPEVNFASLAAALGIPAVVARTRRELDVAAALLPDAAAGPRLIDFRLNRAVLTSWYRDLVLRAEA